MGVIFDIKANKFEAVCKSYASKIAAIGATARVLGKSQDWVHEQMTRLKKTGNYMFQLYLELNKKDPERYPLVGQDENGELK